MIWLLDTSVVAELRKGPRSEPSVASWFGSVDDADVFLSVGVIGEIRAAIERIRRREPVPALLLDAWLGALITDHRHRILPVTLEIAGTFGRMCLPGTISTTEGLLAATARVHDFVVVTRYGDAIARTGVPVFNPFAPSSG